ncbi:DsrE family protein [Geovibrio thiophilus]|uniref:DsrE family protein n=1 Tax=Geovibrio thiophilus TaxID=139438 RepID=A0A410K1N7_9BACT|nr:DsrE family protein [Geovibrio thiophilus]QAR34312.1 DsrE family protein [Geovibrio thiophilus]
MKFGILLQSNDPETAWNGVRFGVASLKKGHEVKIFLMSKGVESIKIDSGKYNVKAMFDEFADGGGVLLACGTCIKSREMGENEACPISTMNDCIDMVEWSDRVITF